MKPYSELKDIDNDILVCKTLRSHALEPNPSPQFIDGDIARTAFAMICLRCTRCLRERYEYLDSTGRRIGTPYWKEPVDYPRTHRLLGDELRAECINRNILVSYPDNGTAPRRRGRR